jgi:acyl-CoA thioester hydrolase
MTTHLNPNPSVFTYIHRVCYSDTDAAGFVYHGRYLEIFERSRAEWLSQKGLSPSKLVNEFNMVMPIRELTMNFYKPGRLDDLLFIDQVIEHRGRTQVTVKQTAQRKLPDSEEMQVIASAALHIVCVDTNTLKPKAWPDCVFQDE